jgi:hypothetical protein
MTILALNVQLDCSLVTKNIDAFAPSPHFQRNQQVSPEGPANHVCEILSEIKDIKYNKVP